MILNGTPTAGSGPRTAHCILSVSGHMGIDLSALYYDFHSSPGPPVRISPPLPANSHYQDITQMPPTALLDLF